MKKLITSVALLAILLVASLNPIHGTEATKYPFVMPAPQVIEKIAALEKLSGKKLSLHADEKKLLCEVAKTGKSESFSFAEAALIASGVPEAKAREKHLAQLASIEAGARKAIENVDSVAGKGKALLQYLHKGPMSKGYSLLQTDLSVILTDGAFNCVSSSVLYNVIARRVGLDVCAFEIPSGSTGSGHVFSVLKDGDRMIPVETTNARGFDIHDNFKKKNKRQLSDLSLVAVIYYNHGVTLAQSKRYHEALLADLCALSLDKGNPQAANNAMAELITWERDLSDAGKYADALEVLRVGLTLAPRDARLVQNRKAVVHDIVMKEVKAGKFAEAWKKVDEHKEALGDKSLAHQMVLMIVDTQAQGHAQKKEWDAAVKIYAAALKKLPGDGHLTNNLVATYDDWARSYMDASNWADAIRVYEQGLTTLPGNGHLTNNLRYAQEQAKR